MANGYYEFDEKAFMSLSTKEQNLLIFKTFNSYRQKTDGRIKKLEKKRVLDTVASAIGGFFGGMFAVITRGWLK